ncbi:hypothetical protein HDU67_005008 [Dinochytrium kinnereticum]|nr:hypothetical protein HDU67_005008 [Dinochytrium kinnereticum]
MPALKGGKTLDTHPFPCAGVSVACGFFAPAEGSAVCVLGVSGEAIRIVFGVDDADGFRLARVELGKPFSARIGALVKGEWYKPDTTLKDEEGGGDSNVDNLNISIRLTLWHVAAALAERETTSSFSPFFCGLLAGMGHAYLEGEGGLLSVTEVMQVKDAGFRGFLLEENADHSIVMRLEPPPLAGSVDEVGTDARQKLTQTLSARISRAHASGLDDAIRLFFHKLFKRWREIAPLTGLPSTSASQEDLSITWSNLLWCDVAFSNAELTLGTPFPIRDGGIREVLESTEVGVLVALGGGGG